MQQVFDGMSNVPFSATEQICIGILGRPGPVEAIPIRSNPSITAEFDTFIHEFRASLRQFHPFARLHMELRLKIWGFAVVVNPPQVIKIKPMPNAKALMKALKPENLGLMQYGGQCHSDADVPPMLHACQGSRNEGLKHYDLCFAKSFPIYFDPSRHLLELSDYRACCALSTRYIDIQNEICQTLESQSDFTSVTLPMSSLELKLEEDLMSIETLVVGYEALRGWKGQNLFPNLQRVLVLDFGQVLVAGNDSYFIRNIHQASKVQEIRRQWDGTFSGYRLSSSLIASLLFKGEIPAHETASIIEYTKDEKAENARREPPDVFVLQSNDEVKDFKHDPSSLMRLPSERRANAADAEDLSGSGTSSS